jgi:SAM-dependent methyltransferase
LSATDKVFAGSIPKLYETHLVPLIFEPYAEDLAKRLAARTPARVLEIAAGTGVATRALAQDLPAQTSIVATDLNQPMLDLAAAVGTKRPVEWRQADAMQLPFEDGAFDAVVCQFGVMFFPDRAKAYAEARRVLAPGGVFLFNAWDRIEENEFADVVTQARAGGFTAAPTVATLAARSRAASPRIPAIAYCQGTPLRSEIEARSPTGLGEATDIAEQAVQARFGSGAVDGKIQAHILAVEK